MPAALPFIAAAAVATTVVSTGYSIYAGERANKFAKKAAKTEQARNDLQAARGRRDAIRDARAAYASAQQSAENQGVAQSSSAIGGQASIASQLNSNLSFLDQFKFYTDQTSAALGKAQTWGNRANTADKIAGASASVFQAAGGIGALEKQFSTIFKKKT